eukprot:Gb_21627 [translate_table: standard]
MATGYVAQPLFQRLIHDLLSQQLGVRYDPWWCPFSLWPFYTAIAALNLYQRPAMRSLHPSSTALRFPSGNVSSSSQAIPHRERYLKSDLSSRARTLRHNKDVQSNLPLVLHPDASHLTSDCILC